MKQNKHYANKKQYKEFGLLYGPLRRELMSAAYW